MMAAEKNKLAQGELLLMEPMSKYTSWRVGGPAKQMYKPAGKDDLLHFIQQLPAGEQVFFVGLGSNLLVRDGGIDGTVINMHGALTDWHIHSEQAEEVQVYVEAGVACAQLARILVKQGLQGGEFFAGIPGTLGGALAMNAGAFGGETWNHVKQVETVNRLKGLVEYPSTAYETAYRSVQGPAESYFVSAILHFKPVEQQAEANAGMDKIKALLNKRSASQPIGVYSCGSVFRNPANDYAARLIESIGLKGYRIGGAQVSEKHANFIINDANATAKDIEDLITFVQTQVSEKAAVNLHREVVIIGELL